RRLAGVRRCRFISEPGIICGPRGGHSEWPLSGRGAVVEMDRAVGWTRLFIPLWNGISRLKRWAAGSFVFCDANVFREMGGFSQELYAAEELEFSDRLKKLALERKKEVIILHRHPLVTSARKAHL